MFHRKRATSNPPRVVKTPPSQAASLAATQAFLANRASNGDLSAAAAAAALRSQTTSPAPVGQIQTKRMQRRESLSSNGSAPGRPGLLRRTSSGSMTERTFRDPSPNRPASSHGPYTPQDEPPPVPAIPKNLPQPPQAVSAQERAARRAASVEPAQRVSSPPPASSRGRGVSLDRGPGKYRPTEGTKNSAGTTFSNVGELERPGSRNSVNFSRPMSPQNSPPHSPPAPLRVKSPPPSKSAGSAALPNGDAARILNSIQETIPPSGQKKNKIAVHHSEGDRSPSTNSSSGPAQVRPPQAAQQQPLSSVLPPAQDTVILSNGPNELPRPKKKKKKTVAPASRPQDQDTGEAFGSAYPSDTDSVTSERSSTNEKPRNYNTRAAGLLMKQPSIVKEDREAEEQEERRMPTKMTNAQLAQKTLPITATPKNTSKVVANEDRKQRSASQANAVQVATPTSLTVPSSQKAQSLSPARSTHFSSHPEYATADGIKHEPPARSVSPAKSALKYSPSRGNSPIGSLPAARRAGLAGSEASDTASNISDDGSKSAPRKKKGVRVSFDDDSVVVGRAASPSASPASPVLMSPQNEQKGRSWLDFVREKQQAPETTDADQDSVMKPTPVLPSFGSVRRERNQQPAPESARDLEPSRDQAQEKLRSMNTSSDHLIGGILSNDPDAKKKTSSQSIENRDPNSPVPPEVTSVEGSGYHSDEESVLLDHREAKEPPSATEGISQGPAEPIADPNILRPEQSFKGLQSDVVTPNVPAISLQPATPGFETSGQEQTGWLGMPGQFPESTDTPKDVENRPTPTIEQNAHEVAAGKIDRTESEPKTEVAQGSPTTAIDAEDAEGLGAPVETHSGVESDDTGDSIYSDAAEDPDELEGDGFGSINAIVESPAASPLSRVTSKSPPTSPKIQPVSGRSKKRSPLVRKESEISEPTSDEGWDRAQAYWSGLSQERKRQLEHAAAPGALDEPVIPNRTMRGPDSVKKKKKVPKKSISPVASGDPPLPPWPDKQYRGNSAQSKDSRPPPKSSMRKSQDEDVRGTQMRSSMRDAPSPKSSQRNGPQRNSMQIPVSEPRGALQKKNRPTSAVAMVDYNKPLTVAGVGHIRASSAGVPTTSLTPVLAQAKKKPQAKKLMLQRNDSDSSSSFKRERAATPASGKYAMKRTMRPSSADARGPSDRPSSISTRTVSPPAYNARRPFSTVGPSGGGMRMSMRDSMDSSRPVGRKTLRDSADSKRPKSPSRFGFGKSSKQKPTDSKQSSRFSSRFGDSSDEDDSRPVRTSRFVDSSDDEPAGLTPVRGIPRRVDEGDSTDLEDSSVENKPNLTKPKLNGASSSLATKPEGTALATGSLRVASGDLPTTALGTGLQAKKAAEKDKKKRSFFGNLGSKKRDDPSRIRKADIESPARRDTPLERSKTERQLARGVTKDERILSPSSPSADPAAQAGRPPISSRTSSAQNSPKSPKLQRRNTPKGVTNTTTEISWPLAQSSGGATGSRPQTSDGAAVSNGTGRPDIGSRRITLQESATAPAAPLVPGKADKKKRFGILRKAFGMQS